MQTHQSQKSVDLRPPLRAQKLPTSHDWTVLIHSACSALGWRRWQAACIVNAKALTWRNAQARFCRARRQKLAALCVLVLLSALPWGLLLSQVRGEPAGSQRLSRSCGAGLPKTASPARGSKRCPRQALLPLASASWNQCSYGGHHRLRTLSKKPWQGDMYLADAPKSKVC